MYSTVLNKIILPIGDLIFGGGYLKTLHKWNQYDLLSEKELIDLQNKGLENILKNTLENVPYYSGLEYDPKISAVENLKRFPILTKEILRKNSDRLISKKYQKKNLRKNYSSGSSGVQSFSYSEKKNVFYLQGLSYHWYMWGGLKIGDPILQFGISPKRTLPKKLKDIFFKLSYEEAFTLDEKDYKRIYNNLIKKKIKYIIGYPSAINQLADYMIKNNLKHTIKSIISLGDKLFSNFEENFKNAFNNPLVIDTYGCAEGLMIACRYDIPYYYISAPHVYIEIVDEEGNDVKDGELGHVLVTCFTNLAQPFIRYKLGDLAIKLPKENYPKNRRFNYPLLEKIVGRETDIIETPNGKKLIVHSFTGIFEYFPDIRQFKIIQNDHQSINIKYIVDDLIPLQKDTLNHIKTKIDKLTNNTLNVVFEKVDYIKPAPSGKPQIIKSNIKNNSK